MIARRGLNSLQLGLYRIPALSKALLPHSILHQAVYLVLKVRPAHHALSVIEELRVEHELRRDVQ
eukprot:15231708-Alexandrium_andersonii.AAC.1